MTLDVLGNDSSNSGSNQISITNVANPANGSASIVNGQIVYTPDAGFSGTDSFDYTITNSNGDTDTATATVTVNAAPNTKPVATDDSATTEEGTPVTLMTVANDSDADGDNLTISVVSAPQNGTATNDGTTITYTPNAGFVGVDSFDYEITDGMGGSDTATETITVTAAPNTKPVAVDDMAVTQESTTITLDTVGNDSDADGDDLTIINVQQPQNGTVSNDDKFITYTPAAGFVGTDTFTYTIEDGNGGTATATETIVVEAIANKAPTANPDSIATGCAVILIEALDNDTDPENDQLSIVSVSGANLGTAKVVNNKIQFTPSNTCEKGNTGNDQLTYTISDGQNTSTGTIDVDIQGADSNTKAETDSVITSVDTPISINVLNNDSGLGLSITMIDNPINGTVTESGGVITYTPNPGFIGQDDFYYDIVDQNGYTDSAMVIVEVVESGKFN